MNITNEKVVEYIDSLYHPLSDELSALRQEGEKGHVPIILRDSETILVTLVEMKRPRRILEIGTAIGYSAAVFSRALKNAGLYDSTITTVEADPLYAGDAKRNLAAISGTENVRLIEGDGCSVMEQMARGELGEGPEKFDMVFIDAAKSHYREFWDCAMKLTSPGSLIICDNVLMGAKTADESLDTRRRFETNIKYMRSFLKYISDCREAVTSIIPAGDGMSISVVRK